MQCCQTPFMMENVDFFGACLDPELSSLLSKLPTAPKTYTENLPAARVRFNTLFTEGFRSVQRAQLPPGVYSLFTYFC